MKKQNFIEVRNLFGEIEKLPFDTAFAHEKLCVQSSELIVSILRPIGSDFRKTKSEQRRQVPNERSRASDSRGRRTVGGVVRVVSRDRWRGRKQLEVQKTYQPIQSSS